MPFAPAQLMALALPTPPRNVSFCLSQSSEAACAEPLAALVSRLFWARPADSGAGAGAAEAPILRYEAEVSPAADFSAGVRARNLTGGGAGAAAALLDFNTTLKGEVLFGRVRAVNEAGPSAWATVGDRTRTVLGLPGPPTLRSLGSGGAPRAYLALVWDAPLDDGAGEAGGGNGTHLSSYEVEVSTAGDFSVGLQALALPAAGHPARNASATLADGAGAALAVGQTYFVRARARNPTGASGYSNVLSRLLVAAPGAVSAAELRAAGERALALTWVSPADGGLGAGVSHVLLGYEVEVRTRPRGGGAGEARATLRLGPAAEGMALDAPLAGHWYSPPPPLVLSGHAASLAPY